MFRAGLDTRFRCLILSAKRVVALFALNIKQRNIQRIELLSELTTSAHPMPLKRVKALQNIGLYNYLLIFF